MLVKNIDTIRFHIDEPSDKYRDVLRERLAKELFDRYPGQIMGDDLMIESIYFENLKCRVEGEWYESHTNYTVADVVVTIVHKEPVRYNQDAINKLIENALY